MDVCVKTDNIEGLLKKWFKFNDSSHEKVLSLNFYAISSHKKGMVLCQEKSIN